MISELSSMEGHHRLTSTQLTVLRNFSKTERFSVPSMICSGSLAIFARFELKALDRILRGS